MTTGLWVALVILLAVGNAVLAVGNRSLRRRIARAEGEIERLRRSAGSVRGDSTGKDPITGCLNISHLASFEERAIGDQERWGCVVTDITGLQRVNDQYGREAGDVALKRMARFLMLQVRAGEAVVRLEGDELLALVTGVDEQTIEAVAERIRQLGEREAPLPFTMGWAARRGAEPLRQTLARARSEMAAVDVRAPFAFEQSRR